MLIPNYPARGAFWAVLAALVLVPCLAVQASGRTLILEDFNVLAPGAPLAGQGGWEAGGPGGDTPWVVSGVAGSDGTPMAGPGAPGASGLIDAAFAVAGGFGLLNNAVITIEFDLLRQGRAPGITGLGVGNTSYLPAAIETRIDGELLVKREDTGALAFAVQADGSAFERNAGELYRVRSVWDLGAAGGTGTAVLYVKNLSAGETAFTQLYFGDGAGGVEPEASLGLTGPPHFWSRAWLRTGEDGQNTYYDNIEVTVTEEGGTPPAFVANYYVSPDGSDANPGTRAAPFATPGRAQEAEGARAPWMTDDITVYFDPGKYFVAETLHFTGADSGRWGHRVNWRAAGPPGSARLIGAREVSGWSVHAGDIWVAFLGPEEPFHTLYENGRRAREARFPNHEFENRFNVASAEYLLADERPGIRYRPGDLPAGGIAGWDLSDAELVISPRRNRDWDLLTLPLVGIDTASRTLQTKKASRTDPAFGTEPIWDVNGDDSAPGEHSRYFLQGVLDFLDQPGEFHHDSSEGILYYWAMDGDPNGQEILVPEMETLLFIEGSGGSGHVRDIRFDGLRFEATDFTDYYPGPFTNKGYRTGMVRVTGSRNIEFTRCHFRNAGFVALLMHDDNADNLVESCLLERASGGIWLNTTPEDSSSANDNHRVINCLIQEMGRLTHAPAVGIKLHMADNCEVANCHIRDVARWGVSIRGRAQNRQSNAGHPGGNLRHTLVERAAQDSGDTGALHTANVSINVEPYNVNTYRQVIVKDTRRHPSVQDPAESGGIFTDFESFGQHFEDVRILGTVGAARFRANPVQGPDPPGLTPNHTFINVNWEGTFDPGQMETGQIGLRPDFPAEYLPEGRVLFEEDFDAYAPGELAGQGGWSLAGAASPSVTTGISGTDGTPVAGPPDGTPAGLFAADKPVPGEIGASPQIPILIEFDVTQLSAGNIPSFGIGSYSAVPASIGIIQQKLIVRGEDFGGQYEALCADGSLFLMELGRRYRIRSIWSTGANGGEGVASLAVRNLSAGEAVFKPLYFSNGAGGLSEAAPLELITDPHAWERAWLRVGSPDNQTYFDNISVRLSPPGHATEPFEAWRQAQFTPAELADASISGPGAMPAGDGVPNLLKSVLGAEALEPLPPELRPGIVREAGQLRYRFVRAAAAAGLEALPETSTDLATWATAYGEFEVVRIEEEGGLRTTVLSPVWGPGDMTPARFFRFRVVR